MNKLLTYAIVPARAGSKGIPSKNIKPLAGLELMAYSIGFAKKLGVDRVICSTDSEKFAEVAIKYGAEVPFLRSASASHDTAMEEDILDDLAAGFQKNGIPVPDLYVWLRPTFVFRDLQAVQRCVSRLEEDPSLTACRTVVDSESRLYRISDGLLVPSFNDHGKSMARRQDTPKGYKVYSTDVFRAISESPREDFLGRKIGVEVVEKICGLDIDDEIDFDIVNHLVKHKFSHCTDYIHLP